ncbi:putative non ribosomal peptide synthetase domain protein [Burkholderia pseudomallei]|nr:putative non ribosomal peptide synthetase domain protein [Burkholderia pseudomallei]
MWYASLTPSSCVRNHSRCCASDSAILPSRGASGIGGKTSVFSASSRSASADSTGASNTVLSATSTDSACRRRDTSCTASSEWPPSSKKLSWRLTRSTCSSSRQIAASASSFAPCGASYSARAYASSAGAGSARRSSLPFGVSGHASSRTYADGTM